MKWRATLISHFKLVVFIPVFTNFCCVRYNRNNLRSFILRTISGPGCLHGACWRSAHSYGLSVAGHDMDSMNSEKCRALFLIHALTDLQSVALQADKQPDSESDLIRHFTNIWFFFRFLTSWLHPKGYFQFCCCSRLTIQLLAVKNVKPKTSLFLYNFSHRIRATFAFTLNSQSNKTLSVRFAAVIFQILRHMLTTGLYKRSFHGVKILNPLSSFSLVLTQSKKSNVTGIAADSCTCFEVLWITGMHTQ